MPVTLSGSGVGAAAMPARRFVMLWPDSGPHTRPGSWHGSRRSGTDSLRAVSFRPLALSNFVQWVYLPVSFAVWLSPAHPQHLEGLCASSRGLLKFSLSSAKALPDAHCLPGNGVGLAHHTKTLRMAHSVFSTTEYQAPSGPPHRAANTRGRGRRSCREAAHARGF